MKCPECGKRLWLVGAQQSADRLQTYRYHECRNPECHIEIRETGRLVITKQKIIDSGHSPVDTHCNTQ